MSSSIETAERGGWQRPMAAFALLASVALSGCGRAKVDALSEPVPHMKDRLRNMVTTPVTTDGLPSARFSNLSPGVVTDQIAYSIANAGDKPHPKFFTSPDDYAFTLCFIAASNNFIRQEEKPEIVRDLGLTEPSRPRYDNAADKCKSIIKKEHSAKSEIILVLITNAPGFGDTGTY